MKKLLLLLPILLLSACITGPQSPQILAGKSLLAMQQTIITVAETGSKLCNQGILQKADCLTIASYYAQAAPAYDLAADSLSVVLIKNDAAAWARYQKEQSAFRTIFDDLLRISAQYPNGGAK